jgi:glycosyltransferase involved in cell wall biosynthesis
MTETALRDQVDAEPSPLDGLSATATSPSVGVLVHALPRYRLELVELLRARLGDRLSLVTGAAGFEQGITLGVPADELTVVENRFLLGRRLLWQRGAVRRLLAPEVAVLELNPRIVSSWAILLLRRAWHRPTILWGHAWPRAGASAASDRLRHVMRRLADAIVVYTETQAAELRTRMPDALVYAAPNGLYPQARAGAPSDARNAQDFVFVGRLVTEKKPLLLLEAFLAALDRLPAEMRLVFVGDGPLLTALEHRADAAGAAGRVRFAGELTGFDELRAVFARALASVVPGTAGLSLVQSLWFGTPVVVARDEAHGPELEAIEDGGNGVLVASNSTDALAAAMVQVGDGRAHWNARRARIAAACAERYALERTVDGLTAAIEGVCR